MNWSGLRETPAGFADGVDNDTTYDAGAGLILNGTRFSADKSWFDNRYQSRPAQVIVVAQKGGDFTSIQTAIDSITDASEENPYLVWVAPGSYQEEVTLKPYVTLEGAGERATIISAQVGSSLPPTRATLRMVSYSEVQELTVLNTGSGGGKEFEASDAVALLAVANAENVMIQRVTAGCKGENQSCYGVYLNGATDVRLEDVTAMAAAAQGNSVGLFNGGQVQLRGGDYSAKGGYFAYGIVNRGKMRAVEINASAGDATFNIAYYQNSDGSGVHGELLRGTFIAQGGVSADGIDARRDNATLYVEDAISVGKNASSINMGLDCESVHVTLVGGSFTGEKGERAAGIRCSATDLEARDVRAEGIDGKLYSHGLALNGGDSTLYNGVFLAQSAPLARAEGGSGIGPAGGPHSEAVGVSLQGDAATRLYTYDVTAKGRHADMSAGLKTGAGWIMFNGGLLQGDDYSAAREGGQLMLTHTHLDGRVFNGSEVRCVLVSRGIMVSTDGHTCP
jgi:hypothetical protein